MQNLQISPTTNAARKRGGQFLNLSEGERKARNRNLKEARKARLLASIPGNLETLPDTYPLTFDMLLPVCGLTYCRASIYELMRLGRFPSNVKIGPNRSAWLLGDVRRYLAERAAYKAVQS